MTKTSILNGSLCRPTAIALAIWTTGCGDFFREHKDPSESAEDHASSATVVASGVHPQGGASNGRQIDASATMLFDYQKDVAVTSLGMTITRFRGFQTNPINYSPSGVDAIDEFIFEVWFRYGSEEIERYHRITAGANDYFSVDDDGWIYLRSLPPGYEVLDSTADYIPASGVSAFTVTGPDYLLTENFPLTFASGVPSTLASEDGYPWTNIFRRTGMVLASKTDYEVNAGLATTGSLACVVNPVNSSGSSQPQQVQFAAIENGHLDYYPTIVNPGSDESAESEDESPPTVEEGETVIAWDREWHISGINIKDPKLRLFRRSTSLLFRERQRPGSFADGSTTAPTLSNAEALARSCNKIADYSPGNFRFIYLDASFRVQITGVAFFCEAFETSVDLDPLGVTLNAWTSGCLWDSALSTLEHSSWNGSQHDSLSITSVSPTHEPVAAEISNIIELGF